VRHKRNTTALVVAAVHQGGSVEDKWPTNTEGAILGGGPSFGVRND
jgi:hypothetical protein